MGLAFANMDLPIYQYVLAELERSKGRWNEVAEGSRVNKRTLEKIARKEIEDPGVSHVQALADYFRARQAA